MLHYDPPVEDYEFLLTQVFAAELPAEFDLDTARAVWREAARFSRDVLLPINSSGDREGCRYAGGQVSTPSGFADAYRGYVEGGWPKLGVGEEWGGLNMPAYVGAPVLEFFAGANQSFDMYTGWADGAAALLCAPGNEALRDLYMPHFASGRWLGSMALTEPQAGTDVGQIRTRAVANDDGSYSLTGSKIFNSSGEHDLTENIVHFVLARIDGAPPGTRGLSLFVVPKYLPTQDGRLGERNGVICTGIEHKMGLNGSATCSMSYEKATGWLLDTAQSGLPAMFRLMNQIRRRTGAMAVGVAELACQNATAYARERRQGTPLAGAASDGPTPLIVQPDVRRILLSVGAYVDGARALLVLASIIGNDAARHPSPEERKAASLRMEIVTPILKGFLADQGLQAVILAQQVFGGHGYIRETGMEQLVRDVRILLIGEGATGVQALDLAMRKNGPAFVDAWQRLIQDIRRSIDGAGDALEARTMAAAVETWQRATDTIRSWRVDDPEAAAAASFDYLQLCGWLLLGWMWLRMMEPASALAAGGHVGAMRKCARGRYFFDALLPGVEPLDRRIREGGKSVAAIAVETL